MFILNEPSLPGLRFGKSLKIDSDSRFSTALKNKAQKLTLE